MNFILIKTDFAQTEQQLSCYALAHVCWDASDGVLCPNWVLLLLQPVPGLAAPTCLLTATDEHRLHTQPGQGGFPHQWHPCVCSQRLLQQGGSGLPLSMTAPGTSLGLIFGGLWGNSLTKTRVIFQNLSHNISLQWYVQNQTPELHFLQLHQFIELSSPCQDS